jgi:hypothetical protein
MAQQKSPPSTNKRRNDNASFTARKQGRRGNKSNKDSVQKNSSPVCIICSGANKYKCPKCRAPYCSVACCRTHKESCSATTATTQSSTTAAAAAAAATTTMEGLPNPETAVLRSKYLPSDRLTRDPLQNAARHRRMLEEDEEDEEGWKIDDTMMTAMDHSMWLRGELKDGGLRQLICELDEADDTPMPLRNNNRNRLHGAILPQQSAREEALAKAKANNPNFCTFIDKLLMLTGVLRNVDGVDVTEEMLQDDELIMSMKSKTGELGGLMLTPIPGGSRPAHVFPNSRDDEKGMKDNEQNDSDTNSNSNSDDSSSDSSSSDSTSDDEEEK